MLAGRGDAGEALSVADSWGGDSMVTFTRAGTTCVRAAFAARTSDGTTALADAIESWAATMPGDTASSTRDGRVVTLTACDPGASATDPPNSSTAALIVAGLRNEVLSEIVKRRRAGRHRRVRRHRPDPRSGDATDHRPGHAPTRTQPLSDADTKAAPAEGRLARCLLRGEVAAAILSGGRDQAMKYLASGWGTMIAEVLCSGSSWNSSVSFTPMRCSSSSSSSFAWSSRSGHAG